METTRVTGGVGVLASWTVHHWPRESGGRVVVFDRLTYAGSRESLAAMEGNLRHDFRQGDIADGSLVAALSGAFCPPAIVN